MIKKKIDTIKSLANHEKDVGSTEVQIGLLTDKIVKLSEHFKKFKRYLRCQTQGKLLDQKLSAEKLKANLKRGLLGME